MILSKNESRKRRKVHIRKKISGTVERPRLVVYRSNLHIYAQVVDDASGNTLVNTTGSGLCFRPLKPKLELGMYLVWKKSQIFSHAMELFLEQLQENLSASGEEEE